MHRFMSADGLALAASTGGDANLPPVVLLHGGGQTRHSWNNVFDALVTAGHHVISFDARGHGDSEWDPRGDYSLDAMVADLQVILSSLSSAPILVGASMGGMTALAAAGKASKPVARALVLVDVTPRINEEGAKQISAFMRGNIQGFESLEAAAEAIARYLPHRPRQADSSGLSRNLRKRGNRWFWHWDPLLLDGNTAAQAQTQARLEACASALTIPVLLIRGDKSNIVTEQEVEHFIAIAPTAEYLNVRGAGHMVVGDRNDAFNSGILEFIQRVQRG